MAKKEKKKSMKMQTEPSKSEIKKCIKRSLCVKKQSGKMKILMQISICASVLFRDCSVSMDVQLVENQGY